MKKFIKKLFSNWLLKLMSLLIAFSLWFVVISIDGDPVGDKTLTNIPVTLLNTELITDQGKVYEVLEGSDVVRTVTFEAPQSVRDAIESGDIVATADLNDLTVTNTVAINFSCPKYNGRVSNISGNIGYVRLNIEDERTTWINIEVNQIGQVAESYLIGNITLNQNRLQVVGPESKISQIARAVVDVNVDGISTSISTQVDVRLQDAEGNDLEYGNVSKNFDTVSVTVTVNATKEVPVEYLTMGVPASGYAVTGVVEGTPKTVLIAGSRSSLNRVTEITVPAEEINVTGATGNYTRTLDLNDYLTGGVIFADSEFDGKASVTVYIEEISEKQLTIRLNSIQILNVPPDMRADFAEGATNPMLIVQGLERDIAGLHESTMSGTIDVSQWMENQGLSRLTPGEYALPVEFGLMEGQNQMRTVTVPIVFTLVEEEAAEDAD